MAEDKKQDICWNELARLYGDAEALLAELDRLELYQAGAHLCMAMEIIRQLHPDLMKPD
jgi:hypothetical protein